MQYDRIATHYPWTLGDLKRLTPRERDFWAKLTEYKEALTTWKRENERGK